MALRPFTSGGWPESQTKSPMLEVNSQPFSSGIPWTLGLETAHNFRCSLPARYHLCFLPGGDDIRDFQNLLGGRDRIGASFGLGPGRYITQPESPRVSPAGFSGSGDHRQRALRFARLSRSRVQEQSQRRSALTKR